MRHGILFQNISYPNSAQNRNGSDLSPRRYARLTEVSLSDKRPPVPTGPVPDLTSGVAGGGSDGTEGVGTRSGGRQQA